MSKFDRDSRIDEAEREKALEERDNKPVLEWDLKTYVIRQVHSYECGELSLTMFT